MFTQNCFIRKNTPELRNKLREITGTKRWSFSLKSGYGANIIHNKVSDTTEDGFGIKRLLYNPSFIDCGENEELLLALAALRDDSDYMQWFVTEANQAWFNIGTYSSKGSFELCLAHDRYMGQNKEFCNTIVPAHKATVEELIEYFKNK